MVVGFVSRLLSSIIFGMECTFKSESFILDEFGYASEIGHLLPIYANKNGDDPHRFLFVTVDFLDFENPSEIPGEMTINGVKARPLSRFLYCLESSLVEAPYTIELKGKKVTKITYFGATMEGTIDEKGPKVLLEETGKRAHITIPNSFTILHKNKRLLFQAYRALDNAEVALQDPIESLGAFDEFSIIFTVPDYDIIIKPVIVEDERKGVLLIDEKNIRRYLYGLEEGENYFASSFLIPVKDPDDLIFRETSTFIGSYPTQGYQYFFGITMSVVLKLKKPKDIDALFDGQSYGPYYQSEETIEEAGGKKVRIYRYEYRFPFLKAGTLTFALKKS